MLMSSTAACCPQRIIPDCCYPPPTWRNRSKGRLREGVPVSRMARRAALTAATTASVCSASGGLLEVRSVWLSAQERVGYGSMQSGVSGGRQVQ